MPSRTSSTTSSGSAAQDNEAWLDYAATLAVLGAVLVWGTAHALCRRVIVLALSPASFFTWGNAARYLYLPAPGFAMLIGDLMLSFYEQARARLSSPHAARILTAVVVAVLAVRFGVFMA